MHGYGTISAHKRHKLEKVILGKADLLEASLLLFANKAR